MIHKAAEFARKAHEGTVRKGTGIPYINHPLEVAVIVAQITDDEEMVAAALLHDVLEDTPVTKLELEFLFGQRVAALVASETEDKSKTWQERKQATVEHLEQAPLDEKILVLGDKLSNLRDTARDYLEIGDKVWQRFNEKKKERHAWYYKSIVERLSELADYQAYMELVQLCRFVFDNN